MIDPTSLLPTLVDVDLGEIKRLEIDRGADPASNKIKGRLVFTRREDKLWQMIEPIDTAANSEVVETLARNLKDMRKSTDAGTITDDPEKFGLSTPAAIVKVYIRDEKTPAATLEIGKKAGERLYVRPKGGGGIEVVNSRLLSAVDRTTAELRDTALFHMPSFQVTSLEIKDQTPARNLKVERSERHWKMVRPVKAPADDDKVEGLVAELSALRIIDGPDGFVADDVRDLAPFGLDKPEMSIEITSVRDKVKPQTLLFGKPVPDHPGQVYAKRGDQDDVIRVDTKILRESLPSSTSLRSHSAVDLLTGRVVRIRIEALDQLFDLARVGNSWRFLEPMTGQADPLLVESFLKGLTELKSSEFLEPNKFPDNGLKAPVCRIKVWQVEPGDKLASSASESIWASDEILKRDPAAELSFGKRDFLRKSIYGQIAGDSLMQAFPDKAADLIPKSLFAFRDRIVISLPPASVTRLTIAREGYAPVIVQPPATTGSKSNDWRIVEPIRAKGDTTAITALLTMLANLHTENWVSDKLGDGSAWGLNTPSLVVKWEANPTTAGPEKSAGKSVLSSGSLRIGKKLPKAESYYANIDGDPRVFVLTSAQVAAFQVELRDKLILTFSPEKVGKVTLHWPKRTLAIRRMPTPKGGPPEWQPEPGYDGTGVDLARFVTFVASLNDLKTTRYIQDLGPFTTQVGLTPPRLAISIQLTGEPSPRWLKLGNATNEGGVLATNVEGSDGPVFVIPQNPAWATFLLEPGRANDLPDNVFTPEPEKPPGK